MAKLYRIRLSLQQCPNLLVGQGNQRLSRLWAATDNSWTSSCGKQPVLCLPQHWLHWTGGAHTLTVVRWMDIPMKKRLHQWKVEEIVPKRVHATVLLHGFRKPQCSSGLWWESRSVCVGASRCPCACTGMDAVPCRGRGQGAYSHHSGPLKRTKFSVGALCYKQGGSLVCSQPCCPVDLGLGWAYSPTQPNSPGPSSLVVYYYWRCTTTGSLGCSVAPLCAMVLLLSPIGVCSLLYPDKEQGKACMFIHLVTSLQAQGY